MFSEMSVYDYVKKYGNVFAKLLGHDDIDLSGENIHADKASQYLRTFEHYGLDYVCGSVLYCLSYCVPYSNTVRKTIGVSEWLVEMLESEKVQNAYAFLDEYDNNMDLIKLSEKIKECIDNDGDFTPLVEFTKEFPKLESENFYSHSVYDTTHRSNGWLYNIKHVSFEKQTNIYIEHGALKATNKNISLYPSSLKPSYMDEFEVFGGYYLDSSTKTKFVQKLLAYKLGISDIFVEAYLNVYSHLTIDMVMEGESRIMYINEKTKVVTIKFIKDELEKLTAPSSVMSIPDDERFEFVKLFCK